jgi:hypothetical protein
MLLYNVTVGVDKDIEEEWLQYMREKHIKDILNTGLFVESKMYKVIHDDDGDTISYSVQYFARSIEDIRRYLEVFAPALVEEHRQKFKNRHITFMTLLDEV